MDQLRSMSPTEKKQCIVLFVLIAVGMTFLNYKYNRMSGKQNLILVKSVATIELSNGTTKRKTSSQQISRSEDVILSATCKPIQYVLFLKVHKAGSSTVTNVLNRYAASNNLTMLLPKNKQMYTFYWPHSFKVDFSADNTGQSPNFLANHARYDRAALNLVFPRRCSFYVSILRNPVQQWESTFLFFNLAHSLKQPNSKDPLKYFLEHPLPNTTVTHELMKKDLLLKLLRNPQFHDLGLDWKDYDNDTHISNAIATIDNDFDLILLAEHFDESLTLLRRRLCWKIDDVVYFKTNARLEKNRRHKKTSTLFTDKIRAWNNADAQLYEHFERKFWREVRKEGSEFYADVARLRERREYYMRSCVEKESAVPAYSTVYVQGYTMRANLTGALKSTCERLLTNEINFVNYFRAIQS